MPSTSAATVGVQEFVNYRRNSSGHGTQHVLGCQFGGIASILIGKGLVSTPNFLPGLELQVPFVLVIDVSVTHVSGMQFLPYRCENGSEVGDFGSVPVSVARHYFDILAIRLDVTVVVSA
jgi:hypothetical protein